MKFPANAATQALIQSAADTDAYKFPMAQYALHRAEFLAAN